MNLQLVFKMLDCNCGFGGSVFLIIFFKCLLFSTLMWFELKKNCFTNKLYVINVIRLVWRSCDLTEWQVIRFSGLANGSGHQIINLHS